MASHGVGKCCKCLTLCSHSVAGTEGNLLIQLHLEPSSTGCHILVQQTQPSTRWNMILRLGTGRSTEYIADAYTSFIKSVESHLQSKLVRSGVASTTTKVQLTGRKADTGIDLLTRYFHLPISEASKTLGICATSLKKICRNAGLARWPHRKVKSVDQKVAKARVVWVADRL